MGGKNSALFSHSLSLCHQETITITITILFERDEKGKQNIRHKKSAFKLIRIISYIWLRKYLFFEGRGKGWLIPTFLHQITIELLFLSEGLFSFASRSRQFVSTLLLKFAQNHLTLKNICKKKGKSTVKPT